MKGDPVEIQKVQLEMEAVGAKVKARRVWFQ